MVQSFAPQVFQNLQQNRLLEEENRRRSEASSINPLSIVAGLVLGGLTGGGGIPALLGGTFGGAGAGAGALQGALMGAGSTMAEGGMGVAKGALGGYQAGTQAKTKYAEETAKEAIKKAFTESGNLAADQKTLLSNALDVPEIGTKLLTEYAQGQFGSKKQPSVLELFLLSAMGIIKPEEIKKYMAFPGVLSADTSKNPDVWEEVQ